MLFPADQACIVNSSMSLEKALALKEATLKIYQIFILAGGLCP
jgi:hypothetical protein